MHSIVMSIRFKNAKISNSRKILSHSNLFCFFGKGFPTPSPTLLDNRNPYSLLKVGEHPAMINEDHLFQFLVSTNKSITIGFKFENKSVTKF